MTAVEYQPGLHDDGAGISYIEDRFDLAWEVLGVLEDCPDGHFARAAGELVRKLALPGRTEAHDNARRVGLLCLYGHIYDINHPELFDDEPRIDIWFGGDQISISAYDRVLDTAMSCINNQTFYLENGMTRWRRLRIRTAEEAD